MSAGIKTGTRGARCNRGGRRRETPARLGARSAKPGPESHLGMRESQGQSRGGTPEGERTLQGAPAAQAAEDDPRLTAFRILLFVSFVRQSVIVTEKPVPPPGSSVEDRGSVGEGRTAKLRIGAVLFAIATRHQQTSGAKARRENEIARHCER